MSDTPVDNTDKYAPRLPDAVRRAAARADELVAEQISSEMASAGPVQGEVPSEATDRPAEERPPREAPTAPQRQQEPQRREDGADETWASRYRTLQGKYDHEIPQMRMHIQQLENLIATMNAAPRQAGPAASSEPAPPPEIPEEDYTTYGPDFVDSTRRWARAEVQRDLVRQQQQIDELRTYTSQSASDRVKDRVRAELDRDPELAGHWQQLDTDPGFNAWLAEFDPFSGNRRLDMLREAYAGGDTVRTGRFFKAYLHEHTDIRGTPSDTYQPVSPVTRYPNGNGNGHYGGNGQVDLTAYAAPGRASNATPGPGAPERRIWTRRDIQAFYEGRLKGRYKGREQEADRLERDILLAAQEGRYRNE